MSQCDMVDPVATAMTSEWQRDFDAVVKELEEIKEERIDAQARRPRAN